MGFMALYYEHLPIKYIDFSYVPALTFLITFKLEW